MALFRYAAELLDHLQVGANMKNGVLSKDSFKIVYVAPMKALAAEMTSTFGKRLASLGDQAPFLIFTYFNLHVYC